MKKTEITNRNVTIRISCQELSKWKSIIENWERNRNSGKISQDKWDEEGCFISGKQVVTRKEVI